MHQRPELIAFSQYKLGGVQNFYYNILSHCPEGAFDIRWIFEDVSDADAKLPKLYGVGEEIIFKVDPGFHETTYEMAKRLKQLISNRPGVVLANFSQDLTTLHLHRRSRKTIFFICHDEGYIRIAKEFEFLIDVFIAHNHQFYEAMIKEMPDRRQDVFFIPYGVKIPAHTRVHDEGAPLRIAIAARMQVLKGVHDLPIIDDLLKQRGLRVEWTMIGEGPERRKLEEVMLPRGNSAFFAPATTQEVLALLQQSDVFILPSRLDGLPVALLESMSVGCVPVISAFNEGIRQVVTSDIGFIVPVGDNAQFADKTQWLNNHRDELRKRSVAARERVMKDYNIEIQAQKYFSLFNRYRELKKPVRRKLRNYGGWLDHPWCPRALRPLLRKIRKSFF
jgi:glycosyltransferase involved in cell wall biosynthesis